MSLLHRTSVRCGHRAATTVFPCTPAPTPPPPPPASSNALTSSTHLWEAAIQAFYVEFAHYTAHTSDVLCMLRAAEAAMHRCLAARRAEEALEVYATLCRCGVAGGAAHTATAKYSAATSLDQLAQEAVQRLPHRVCQQSALALVMAAELDAVTLPSSLLHPNMSCEAAAPTHAQRSHVDPINAKHPAGASVAPFPLVEGSTVSAAERTRIRIRQRLHTLHATGQLPQTLGKEYCLVEMQEVAAAPSTSTSTAQRPRTTRLRDEVEVGPLCTLAHCVLTHPFTYATPSAAWAQRELLWETDLAPPGRSSAPTAFAAEYCSADATRLAQIDQLVRPYRQLCRTSLDFLFACVPEWDTLFFRRVAETLVLPAAAHVVFPAEYHRARRRATKASELACTAAVATTTTTWTDAAAHQLFCHPCATPLARVEAMVRRRVHHDVVVPDAAYVIYHFHQLQQLARHREVILSHAVVVELVTAAARTDNPLRFHIRRVLQEVMQATTTAVTAAAAQRELLVKERGGRGRGSSGGHAGTGSGNGGGAGGIAAPRRSLPAHGGYTVLGLQDELALLDGCPERFFLHASSADDAHRRSDAGSAPRWSTVSVVLVAKQLERIIAVHDRGESFVAPSADSGLAAAAPGASLDVDGLVSHLMGGTGDAPPCALRQAVVGRAEPLFKSRSRGRWARLPTLVATTSDATRSAAFQVGLHMHPPASLAP